MINNSIKLDKTQKNKFIIDKNNPRILMLPSDNSKSSGAFISMANLVNILRVKYNLNIYVILPEKGDGVEILDEFAIPYSIVRSYHWIIPLILKNSKRLGLIIFVKKILNKRAISTIGEFIDDNNINLVHLNTTYTYVGALASLTKKTPFVWHLREFLEESYKNTIWNGEDGYKLINKANKIVVVSDSLKNKYIDVFDNEKLIRIYNGVDDKRFYKPDKLIFNNDKLIFIMVGAINDFKGQLDFASACVNLFSTGFKNFEIWFIGEGDEKVINKIKDMFNSVGLNNFKFLGYKKNVEDYYDKADISFTCSDLEAFGRTTVEAMLSGNLVIGANSAGTKELLNNNRGLLYELHDFNDLYEKMKFAIENPELSREIARNGRSFMHENMTAEKNADNIYKLYLNILDEK